MDCSSIPTSYATLEANGRAYRLAYSLRAIGQAERELGVDILHTIGRNPLRTDELFAQLYASLKPCQPELTPDQVDALITLENTAEAVVALADCYARSGKNPNPPEAEGAAAES